jgi:hypothetical protein
MALTPEQLIAKAEAKEAQAATAMLEEVRNMLNFYAAGYRRLAEKYRREGR